MRLMKVFPLISIVLLLMAGCGFASTPAATPTVEVVSPTSTPRPAIATGTAVPQDIQLTYENPAFGFAFDYSDDWTLEVLPAGTSQKNRTLSLKRDSIQLEIEYGLLFEFNGIKQPEMPLGEWQEQEPVDFLGERIPQSAVVEDGRFKMVLFPALDDIFRMDDLFFRIILKETGPLAQNEIDLTGDIREEVREILASFKAIERSGTPPDPYPGWEIYLNLGHGFSVRYPAAWTAEERQVEVLPAVMENALILTRDNANLMFIYHFKENYLPVTTQILGGLLVDEGTVSFLGAKIPKLTLVYREKEKGVFYNGLEPFQADALTFHITLMDNRAGIGYDRFEVSDPVQQEAETILKTVRQFSAVLTPEPEGVKSEGREIFLTFDSCFDLDEGIQVGQEAPGCDFQISRVSGGNDLRINFQPAAPAAFGFDSVFTEQPLVGQCAVLDGLSSAEETIAPLDSRHVCYQTNAGRFGYLIFRALTSDGVTFDWQTFTTAGPLAYTGSQENTAITLKDITVPDGTVFEPGESFDKTWQIMNTGTTTWTGDYAIRFKEGHRLGAPFEVALPGQVPPGGTVNITVAMTAPEQAGEYISHWVLRDELGRPFGVGADGSETFWALIVVEEAEPPEEEEEGQESGTPVVETTLEIDPVSFSGACPASIDVSYSITTEGLDQYTYELQAGAVQSGFQFFLPDPKEENVSGSGPNTKWVNYTVTINNPVDGWMQVVVSGEVEHRSEKVNFKVNCE